MAFRALGVGVGEYYSSFGMVLIKPPLVFEEQRSKYRLGRLPWNQEPYDLSTVCYLACIRSVAL
jgi:hypothetical protein